MGTVEKKLLAACLLMALAILGVLLIPGCSKVDYQWCKDHPGNEVEYCKTIPAVETQYTSSESPQEVDVYNSLLKNNMYYVYLYKDPETNCQYLMYEHGITPRNLPDGMQKCD